MISQSMRSKLRKMAGYQQVRSGWRRLSASLRSRVVVLLYHRVYTPRHDPFGLSVSAENFAAHMELLSQQHFVITATQLQQWIRLAQLPPKAVVVTFDDGYLDNLHCALPILEQYDLPATIFTTSDTVGQQREFWWDELERLFLESDPLPGSLPLALNGKVYHWQLPTAAAREEVYVTVHQLLQPLSADLREQTICSLWHWSGHNRKQHRLATHRPVNASELKRLSDSPLIEIGAHTCSHPFLPSLSADEQLREMVQSQRALERLIHRPVTMFAYPYGAFTQETRRMAAQAGFDLAFTVEEQPIEPHSNRYRLGRFTVGDWDADTFQQRLDSFFKL